MEYLLLCLLCAVIVLLVLVLVRQGRSKTDPYLQVSLDNLSRDNSETRKELLGMLEQYRSGVSATLNVMQTQLAESLSQIRNDNASQLERYRASVTQSVSNLNLQVSDSLDKIRKENDTKLEGIRQSVDTRLQSSLRESFDVVSKQLDAVHQGLGEMQSLANGVGDLKRLMGNIKSRGIMGEVQAQNILEDILLPSQYETNCITRHGSNDRVEFAVILPGREEGKVLLPIDCKFPKEDYEKLLNAQDLGDRGAMDASVAALRIRVIGEAKDISQKYLDPPHTTDFALLFLPFEGLYAEVLRIPGLVDELQRKYKVVLSGPTTLAAILNSLQMGFRTLAIEKRSEEVWNVLSAVKTEFARFSDELARAQDKLSIASSSLENVGKRTKMMDRKLRDVEVLEEHQAEKVLEENATISE
jgi:DNA recombination protein RmuC